MPKPPVRDEAEPKPEPNASSARPTGPRLTVKGPKRTPTVQASVRERRVEINREFATIEEFLAEYVSNISLSGAFIRTRDPWPVGTRLRMKFTILAEDPEILEGSAEVVRVSDEPRGMGVTFLELPESSRRLIDKMLHRKTRPGRAPLP